MRGQQAQPRRLAKAIDAGAAASATGMARSTGHVDAWAPLLRRLTPQVVGQAGRPHRHLSGPAAHQGVNAASKGAHARGSRPTRSPRPAHSPRPARSPTPARMRRAARTPPVSRGCRFESCRRPSPAHSPRPACIRRPTRTVPGPRTGPRPHASAGPPTSAVTHAHPGIQKPRNLKRSRGPVAEDGGFEPPRACTQHAFQACAIGH